MKRSDLTLGVVYAHEEPSSNRPPSPVRLLDAGLWAPREVGQPTRWGFSVRTRADKWARVGVLVVQHRSYPGTAADGEAYAALLADLVLPDLAVDAVQRLEHWQDNLPFGVDVATVDPRQVRGIYARVAANYFAGAVAREAEHARRLARQQDEDERRDRVLATMRELVPGMNVAVEGREIRMGLQDWELLACHLRDQADRTARTGRPLR